MEPSSPNTIWYAGTKFGPKKTNKNLNNLRVLSCIIYIFKSMVTSKLSTSHYRRSLLHERKSNRIPSLSLTQKEKPASSTWKPQYDAVVIRTKSRMSLSKWSDTCGHGIGTYALFPVDQILKLRRVHLQIVAHSCLQASRMCEEDTILMAVLLYRSNG